MIVRKLLNGETKNDKYDKYIIIDERRINTMSESNSRYSIIANLTQSKLDIITAKSQLEGDVKHAKQKAEALQEDLKDWEQSIKAENERIKRDKQRKIKEAEREAKNAEDRKKAKAEAYDAKIKAIDEAMKKIEEISKTAPNPANPN
jgi:chromosome segregation ATPase